MRENGDVDFQGKRGKAYSFGKKRMVNIIPDLDCFIVERKGNHKRTLQSLISSDAGVWWRV